MDLSPTGPCEDASGATTGDKHEDVSSATLKRPRAAVTFQLPSGESFDLSEAGAAAFPDGMLSRLVNSALTKDAVIPFTFPCDRAAFEYAIAVHEHHAKCGKHAKAAPLTCPINPQSLSQLWEYLQLDFGLFECSRELTPLHINARQILLTEQLILAQELSLLLNALRKEARAMGLSPKLRWPTTTAGGSCTPGSCALLVWLGGCHRRWKYVPDDLDEAWPPDVRHVVRWPAPPPPQPLGFFSSDVFDMFREDRRDALADLVRLYLPEREAECNALTLKSCTSDHAGMLQDLCLAPPDETMILVPRLMRPCQGRLINQGGTLLGGFAIAMPVLPVQLFDYVDHTTQTHELRFGIWEVTVTVSLPPCTKHRDVAGVDCERLVNDECEAGFITGARTPIFIFNAHLNGNASYDIQVPLLGVKCCQPPHGSNSKLATRNAFFGPSRKPIADECDITEQLVSESLSPSQYKDVLKKYGVPNLDTHCSSVVVPLQSMHPYTALKPLRGIPECSDADLKRIAKAWDKSDALGDESCAAFEIFQFELHALKPEMSPFLEAYDKGLYGDPAWAEFGYLEIAGV